MVKHVNSDGEFTALLEQRAGLIVVDYFATWCGPCQHIAPFFEQLSNKYPNVAFGKVDVDKCPATAANQGVSAMPTFIFYINKVKVDSVRGANNAELEAKVKKWAESASQEGTETVAEVSGQSELACFISKGECECLNESDAHNFKMFLESKIKETYLESDCDEQLIISIPFNQPVKLHSVKFKGPQDYAPKVVKIFLNLPVTLGFEEASRSTPVQTLEQMGRHAKCLHTILLFRLTEKQVIEGEIINLMFVKFQNVRSVTFFVASNQGKKDVTRITRLQLYGSPINATNMQDFKRVSGKAGEAH